MGSLRRCASGEQVSSPLDSVLHGLREGAAQGAGVAAGADGPQSLDLDLPGPLLGDTKLLRDFAQGEGLAAIEAVTHLDDPGLPLGQSPHGLDERQLPLPDLDARVVVAGALVREQLAKLGAFLGVDLRVDAGDGLADLAQAPGLLRFYTEPLDELLLGSLAAELDAESVLGASQAVESVNDVCGQTHGAGVVGDGAGDGLTDPPRRVSREAVAHLGVELLDGPDKAGVPLLDEGLEGHPAPAVLLGDGDHEPKVGLDEAAPGLLVATVGAPAEVLLLAGVEQPATSDPAQILCENVLRLHHT